MPSLRIVIPTRDSARWIGKFLEQYRRIGVEPLYIFDERSTDSTLSILKHMDARVANFTPGGEYVEAGMIEFAAREACSDWILRMDDDEFPSLALVNWAQTEGVKSLAHAWALSCRELFFIGNDVYFTQSPNRFAHPFHAQYKNYLYPLVRLLHVNRVDFISRMHSPGIQSPIFLNFAPQEAFFVHCNSLLRTKAERYAKLKKYESILSGSSWRLSDTILPECFPPEFHNASQRDLAQFKDIFDQIERREDSFDIPSDEKEIMLRAVANFTEIIRETPPEPSFVEYDTRGIEWLKFVPEQAWPFFQKIFAPFFDKSFKSKKAIAFMLQNAAPLNTEIRFHDPLNARIFLREGWDEPDKNGAWSIGDTSTIRINLRKPRKHLVLRLRLHTFSRNGDLRNLKICAPPLSEKHFSLTGFTPIFISVPLPFEKCINVCLRMDNIFSPTEVGSGDDPRPLGVFLHSMEIVIDRKQDTSSV